MELYKSFCVNEAVGFRASDCGAGTKCLCALKEKFVCQVSRICLRADDFVVVHILINADRHDSLASYLRLISETLNRPKPENFTVPS